MESPRQLARPAGPAHTPTDQERAQHTHTQIHQQGSHFEGDVHVSGGLLIQGNAAGITFNTTAAARSDYAGQFAHSTLQPVKAYVPRDRLHDQIRTELCGDAGNNSTKTLIVSGLGGMGKTQLVLDYVQRHRTEYKATFWIEAGRKESLERDFIHLYQTLFGVQIATGTDTIGVDDAVTMVKSWFTGRQGPWLIVFDGADAIENSQSSDYIDIKRFVPNAASLHVVITSRSSTAKGMTQLDGVQVGEIDEAQATELFYQYSQLPRDDIATQDTIKQIVQELGHLALAVTLAATYVGTTPRLQSDIRAYLPEYRQRRRELLRQNPERLVHQYSESVLTTWETSFRAVAEQCAEASALITMLCFLSFDDIFLELFGVSRQTERADVVDGAANTG